MIRDPLPRLQSALNHTRGNGFDEALGAVPWAWIVRSALGSEIAYCEVEMAWFTREEGPARTVIRFGDFVRDLEGTLSAVYRACLGDDALPAYAPREHPPRERKAYVVNRGLLQLGIDEAAIAERLGGYRDWCRGPPREPGS